MRIQMYFKAYAKKAGIPIPAALEEQLNLDTLWRRNLSGSKPGTLFSSATAGIVLYIIGIGLLFSFMLETPF